MVEFVQQLVESLFEQVSIQQRIGFCALRQQHAVGIQNAAIAAQKTHRDGVLPDLGPDFRAALAFRVALQILFKPRGGDVGEAAQHASDITQW